MNDEIKSFLLKYSFIILLDTNTDTIGDALTAIVSDTTAMNAYYNMYGVDMAVVYWEWMLLPTDNQDRILINRITFAQYIVLTQYERKDYTSTKIV